MPRKMYKHFCDYCGNEHEISSSIYHKLISGKSKHSYCSIECKSYAQRKGETIKCENCNKLFYRRQQYIDRQNHHFCCTNCEFEYKHKQSLEIRKCEICGKNFETKKISKQRFCSHDCQNKWQKNQIGELNSHFKSTYAKCEYCGNIYHIAPYKLNLNQHKFCSILCRQKWYSEVWSQQDEWKEKSREIILNTLKSGKMSKINSKPQQILDTMLSELNFEYIREYCVKYYAVDNYLMQYNLMIEVQGDYWHCSPIKFTNKICSLQFDKISKDKAKHTYIKNHYNIEILYLWEADINNRPYLCEKLIKEYIDNNGKLSNYHSFNYSIVDEKLCLNENIIVPYQDMNVNDYKHLLVKVS